MQKNHHFKGSQEKKNFSEGFSEQPSFPYNIKAVYQSRARDPGKLSWGYDGRLTLNHKMIMKATTPGVGEVIEHTKL